MFEIKDTLLNDKNHEIILNDIILSNPSPEVTMQK